jgi:hypothetical protein
MAFEFDRNAHYDDPEWKSDSWKSIEKRLAVTTDARHRALLENILEHHRGEAARNIGRVMATLVPEPEYHFWGSGRDTGPKGAAAVREYYKNYFRMSALIIAAPKDRIVVDDNTISHEGRIVTLTTAADAQARGYNIDDESAHYILHSRSVMFWSFTEDALAYGEDAWGTRHPDDFEKVERKDLPPVYFEYLDSIGQEA